MEKIINSKKYFFYSSLPHELKKIYCEEIYRFLSRLIFEYQGFQNWYNRLFEISYNLKQNREIVICEHQLNIVGIAIIKNDLNEKKICTLRVSKSHQRQGIGHKLIEMCFEQLNTEKPMITLHKNKLNQFEKLLNYYDFELEQTQKHYYSIFSTELVFNGTLPQKEFAFNQIELMDMEQLYRKFIYSRKQNFEDFVDACIQCWYHRENMRQVRMLEY